MIRMKALRPFGYDGVNEGRISRGREFSVSNELRARDLEDGGLAFRLDDAKMQPAPENKMQRTPASENKAAETGPLPSPGGETGEEWPVQSLHPAPRRRGRPPKVKPSEDE